MKYFVDGNQMVFTNDDFVNLQESPVVFEPLEAYLVQRVLKAGSVSALTSEEARHIQMCIDNGGWSPAGIHQPSPQPGEHVVLTHVLADIRERAEAGKLKYGCYLQTHNGRDALMDAYQEAIDLVMYLRQVILERENDQSTP